MKETILLTGAIRPSWPVQRNDSVVRLMDYLCAIRRWLNVSTVEQVIYCDASGCTIPEKVFNSEKFESLSFDAATSARQFEAGRAEAETLAFVLEKSRFRFDAFFKCTGRLFVNNFVQIQQEITRMPENPLFLRPWYLAGWADTRFFRITTDQFQQWIVPRLGELTGRAHNGHVIESLFFEYLDRASPFSEPILAGHSGHTNQPYHTEYSPREKEQAIGIMEHFGLEIFGIH